MLGSRRGLTPIVATIILIVFSLLIGTVVMAWGEQYVEARANFVAGAVPTQQGCGSVSVHAYELDNAPQACAQGGVFTAIIENGPVPVQDMQVTVIGTKSIFSAESTLTTPLNPLAADQISFSFGDVGDVRSVKLIPKVKSNNQAVTCADKSTSVTAFDCSWR